MTFEEFVHSRGTALVRFARLLTDDDQRAEDLVQDVLTKTYTKWRRVSATDRPDVYVRKMIVNANISWWRRRANRDLSVAEVPERPGTDDLGASAVERDQLWRLVAALPVRQRAVLVLRYYEDLDDASIAEILGCADVTVRTTALRGLNALREHYPTVDSPLPRSAR